MDISKEDFIKKYCKVTNEYIKYPIYKHEKFDKETNMYIGLEVLKTLDELEKEQLELENQQVDKTKICLTQEQQVIQDLSIELAKLKLQLLNK